MAYISTYHTGDSDPARELTLSRPDGGAWLDAGDTVALIDRLPNGTIVTVPATITAQGDSTNPSLVTAPPPNTQSVGNVRTEVRKTSLASKVETFAEDLVYPVIP